MIFLKAPILLAFLYLIIYVRLNAVISGNTGSNRNNLDMLESQFIKESLYYIILLHVNRFLVHCTCTAVSDAARTRI